MYAFFERVFKIFEHNSRRHQKGSKKANMIMDIDNISIIHLSQAHPHVKIQSCLVIELLKHYLIIMNPRTNRKSVIFIFKPFAHNQSNY